MKAHRFLLATLTITVFLASGESLAQPNGDPSPRVVQANVSGWRDLKIGMSESKVKQLLGKPSKIDANEVFLNWNYGSPVHGYVIFDPVSRKVVGWSGPLKIVSP